VNWRPVRQPSISADTEIGRGDRPWGLAVTLCALLGYVILMISLQLRLYENLHLGVWDLSYFNQALYNSLHGCPLCVSGDWEVVGKTLFAEHIYAIMLLLLPLYALIPRTELLFVVQAIVVAIGAVPLYLTARHHLRHEGLATVLAVGYLLYPPLQWANLNGIQFGFHPETFFPTLLMTAFHLLTTNRRRWSLLFFVLSVSVVEHYALTVAALGLWLALTDRSRWRRFGLLLAVASVAWFVIAGFVLVPLFRGAAPLHFARTVSAAGGRDLSSWAGLFTHATSLLVPYLWGLLSPFLFLPLAAPSSLAVIIPNLALNFALLSSGYPQAARINLSYHVSSLVPVVFIGAVLGLRRVMGWSVGVRLHGLRPALLVVLILGAGVLSNYRYGPVPGTMGADEGVYESLPEPRARSLHDLETLVLRTDSVSAEFFLGSRFTQRAEIYRFPRNWQKVDVVLIDEARVRLLGKAIRPYEQLRACPDFDLAFQANAFAVYRHTERGNPSYFPVEEGNFDNEIRLSGFRLDSKRVLKGGTVVVDLSWTAQKKPSRSYTVFVHLVSAEGARVAQSDSMPANSSYPTTEWSVGDAVYDRHELTVAETALPGAYTFQAGLYDAATGERLPVFDAMGNPRDTKIDLAQIQIAER
jgi:uncharacterized membrane protein